DLKKEYHPYYEQKSADRPPANSESAALNSSDPDIARIQDALKAKYPNYGKWSPAEKANALYPLMNQWNSNEGLKKAVVASGGDAGTVVEVMMSDSSFKASLDQMEARAAAQPPTSAANDSANGKGKGGPTDPPSPPTDSSPPSEPPPSGKGTS